MTITRNFRQNCSNITYSCRKIFMSIFYINLLKLMSKELVFDVNIYSNETVNSRITLVWKKCQHAYGL